MGYQRNKTYEAIVIGTSAGGMNALKTILQELPPLFPLPVMVVQHRAKDERELLEKILQSHCKIRIKQADEKEMIRSETVYIAPPDYHLLVEQDRTFSLSTDHLYNYSRPSIDILFETASYAYKDRLIGIVLTGSNSDGAKGLEKISLAGGMTIAQNPERASFSAMPQAAINTGKVRYVLELEEISHFLISNLKMQI